KTLISLIICVLVASTGIYYAFFACYFLFAAGIFAFLKQKKIRHLLVCGFLVATISLGVFANISPSIAYQIRYGKNTNVANRTSIEAEIYGLKLSQMLLPVGGHRISYLANLRAKYNKNSALSNENGSSTMGITGSLGFLFLILGLFHKTSNKKIFTDLSKLNILAVLLGTIGGLGSLFALIISPSIRAYNRISVYIAFFSIFAVMLLLENISYKYFKTKKANILYCSVLGLILVFGIFDQTTGSLVPNYSSLKAEYINDKDFVAKIEASIPGDSMIFQLPYVPFPENPQVNKMRDYELFRGYLQSKNLRWSYGTMKGRERDDWQKEVAAKPINEFVESIALAGFNGIYLDRNGYADLGADIEAKLTRLLDSEPLVSSDNRLVFFNMSEYNNELKEYYGNKWDLKRELAFNPLFLTWLGGFSGLEGKPEGNWRWCSSEGELHINTTSQNERKVELEMLFATGYEDMSNLFINSSLFSEQLNINSKSKFYSKTVIIPPGKHVIKFKCDAKRVDAPKDTRVLVFKVVNFNIKSLET
ncbi:MAG: hypothetical protein PHH31_10325, partial [Acidaminococcaceae bacterium]|nr:hypothetical protein [Acidaminococcaceae bacterium]